MRVTCIAINCTNYGYWQVFVSQAIMKQVISTSRHFRGASFCFYDGTRVRHGLFHPFIACIGRQELFLQSLILLFDTSSC